MNADAINRFFSRRQRLDHAFLSAKLKGAKSYRRIAGYFRSSIFELVGEEIAGIPKVQIVCNSELDASDVAVSKHVRETALKERWNDLHQPDCDKGDQHPSREVRLPRPVQCGKAFDQKAACLVASQFYFPR